MGRPPSNGAPSFRFYPVEVAQMEAILQKHEGHVPPRDLIDALAQRFSQSPERAGKIVVQMKQIWNWFQNKRYALRAKLGKSVGKPTASPVTRDEVTPVRNVPHVPQSVAVFSGPRLVRNTSEAPFMEFEAKSSRDGAWYDVQKFLSHRYLETGNPEVLVRFSGFGDEDEWLNIRKHVRQRSLPCEALECIAVLPGDLILCFQEGKEQALYFDAHVLDTQRRRHDLRGCRCRFLVRFDHDQSEEIVPLRKICRRPETDYRLQQLHSANEAAAVSTSIPVVDLTNSTTMGLTSPNPTTTPITLSPSPTVGAGPFVRDPTPIGPPTSVVSPTSLLASAVPATSAPVTPVVTESESNKTDDVSPAQIPVPELIKVNDDNRVQIPALVPDTSKIETDDSVLVPELIMTEIDGPVPVQVPLHEAFQVEKDIQIPVFEPNKSGNSNAETVSQAVISVPGREKVESSTPSAGAETLPTEELKE